MAFTDIPSYFATSTGMNEVSAQLILSIAIIFTILLPYLIVSKGKPNSLLALMLIFFGEAISLSLGWSPFWIMVALLALTAAGIAFLGSEAATGG